MISTHSSLTHFNELLEALLSISSKIHAEEISAEAAKQIVSFLHADMCIISWWDQENQTLLKWANFAITKKRKRPEFGQIDSLKNFPASRKVLEDELILQFNLDDPKENPAEIEVLEKYNCRSMLMLPLTSQQGTIGLIEVFDPQNRRFNYEEILLARLFSTHVGGLIERRLLIQAAETRTAELEAVRKASISLTSHLDFEDILKTILKSALELFEDASNAHIFMVQEDQLVFSAALWSDGRLTGPLADPRQDGLTYTVARSGELIIIPDMDDHPLFENTPKHWKGSIIGLPLKNGSQVIGVMNIAFNHPRQYTTETLNIIQLLGDQAAVAIERTRATQETKNRAEDLETLWQNSLTLTASLDIEVVYKAILQAAIKLSKGGQDAHLFTYQNKILSFADSLWADGKQGNIWAEPRQDGLTYTVARSGETIAVENTKENPLFQDLTSWDQQEWEGAIVSLPIKLHTRVIGVLNIAYSQPRRFSPDFLRLIRLLADQAALAMSNASLHRLVSEQARTDPLTWLANRRAFDQRLEEELLRAKRYDRIFTLIMIDLNGFKRVNDTFGHLVGDKTLARVGQALSSSIRDTDLLARLGGDEFVLLLPETDCQSSEILAKKIKSNVESYDYAWPQGSEPPPKISLSYGLASFPENGRSAASLLKFADDALYAQKGGSR